jgi:hypothetical protein
VKERNGQNPSEEKSPKSRGRKGTRKKSLGGCRTKYVRIELLRLWWPRNREEEDDGECSGRERGRKIPDGNKA